MVTLMETEAIKITVPNLTFIVRTSSFKQVNFNNSITIIPGAKTETIITKETSNERLSTYHKLKELIVRST